MNVASDTRPSSHFQIDEWIVDPDAGRISRDGQEVRLEPRVMDVLVYLAQHPNIVISRETLETEVWTGMVVGYSSVPSTIIKLRKALGDNSRNPRYIETVSKRGYRLIANVQLKPDKVASTTSPPASSTAAIRIKNYRAILAGIMSLLILFAVLVYMDVVPSNPGDSASAVKPSVLVIPFKNLNGDAQGENLSEGVTDDLITDLSRVGDLRVIARQTANYYKDNHANLKEIWQQLKVRYIVEGSIRKSGEQIRLNVQLTDTVRDESIWGEHIDTNTEHIFTAQDGIAKKVIIALSASRLINARTAAVTHKTNSFAAYDAFLVGQRFAKNRTREGYEQTIKAYQHALNIDPNYARAYGALAVELTRGYRYQLSDLSMDEAHERALKFARKAVSLDKTTPQIYWSLGYVHLHRREYNEAEKAARQSVTLSPSYADGYALLANIANWRGKPKDAEKYVMKAMQLNPYYTFQYPSTLGMAYYHQGRYKEAVRVLKDALERNETALNPHIFLAASYTELGLGDEAAWEINQMNVNHSDVKISNLSTILPYEHIKYMNRLVDDLRQAGIQE